MKRILILVAVGSTGLAIAGPASAATTDTGTSSVTADVANTLEASFPSDYPWGNLSPGSAGTESAEQVLNVKSNQTWGVKTSTDIASGKMTEWTGALYALKVLTNALQWKLSSLGGTAQGTSYAAYSSTEALVTGSQPVTSDSGTNVGVKYKQVVSYGDVNAGVNDYRILVNYNVAQGF